MQKYKILLVDDELNIREAIDELLTYQNYDVKSAKNGDEALEILENWIPNLILSDIMMPVMDGHTFHEIIQKNRTLSAIPFVFLTAKKEVNIRRRTLIEGADDFISKPFKIKELTALIDSKLNRFQKIKSAYSIL